MDTKQNYLQAGMRIKFTQTLTENACGDYPDRLYARKGGGGRITRRGGCKEGFWVLWDGWLHAAFGASSREFIKE